MITVSNLEPDLPPNTDSCSMTSSSLRPQDGSCHFNVNVGDFHRFVKVRISDGGAAVFPLIRGSYVPIVMHQEEERATLQGERKIVKA